MINEPVLVPPRKSLSKAQRVKLFDFRQGICGICHLRIQVGQLWIDEHMIPREISADDSFDNRWPVHVACAKKKTVKDQADIAKVKRVRAKHLGIKKPRTMTRWRKMNGEIVTATRER